MQTLKDVFQREDERLNLVNVSICVGVVVLIVILAFGLKELKFAFQGSPTDAPTPTEVQRTGGD